MKVILLNGSPKAEGCTYTALTEVQSALSSHTIDTELIHIGKKPIQGCTACGACRSLDNQCVFSDDMVNTVLAKLVEADGLVIGSPVYYAAPNGALLSFLDRLFFASNDLSYKVGASVVSARRAGTTAAFDVLNKYFTISNMPVVSSCYWNMVHGNTPDEVKQDEEGLQVMRTLGHNMAWLLQCLDAGRKMGVELPEKEQRVRTNFIR